MDTLHPLVEIALGAVLLVASLLIHGAGMYAVQARHAAYRVRPRTGKFARQTMLSVLILMMVATHIAEIMAWGVTLTAAGGIATLRDAYYYASVTYTTLGYGEATLPRAWQMLAPMIAMSGVFAFGWTTGVLVNVVAMMHSDEARERGER
jgi:hypothetical protein